MASTTSTTTTTTTTTTTSPQFDVISWNRRFIHSPFKKSSSSSINTITPSNSSKKQPTQPDPRLTSFQSRLTTSPNNPTNNSNSTKSPTPLFKSLLHHHRSLKKREFWNDVYTLTRLINRNKSPQHKSIHFKKILHVSQHIRRLQNLKPEELITSFLDKFFAKGYKKASQLAKNSNTIQPDQIPSAETFHFILTRLQGFHHLLRKTLHVLCIAYDSQKYQLSKTLFMPLSILFMGCCARLFVIGRVWLIENRDLFNIARQILIVRNESYCGKDVKDDYTRLLDVWKDVELETAGFDKVDVTVPDLSETLVKPYLEKKEDGEVRNIYEDEDICEEVEKDEKLEEMIPEKSEISDMFWQSLGGSENTKGKRRAESDEEEKDNNEEPPKQPLVKKPRLVQEPKPITISSDKKKAPPLKRKAEIDIDAIFSSTGGSSSNEKPTILKKKKAKTTVESKKLSKQPKPATSKSESSAKSKKDEIDDIFGF